MSSHQFLITKTSEKDRQKIRDDLRFIRLLAQSAQEINCRVIISGGYAVDGCLGQITRPHRDIDIQIYGQDSVGEKIIGQLVTSVQNSDPIFSGLEVEEKGCQEFYHAFFVRGQGFGADLYYLQTTGDPFGLEKQIVKTDGSLSEKQQYETITVSLEGVTFEATTSTTELVDKRYKREIRKDPPKAGHDQDMENLQLIADLDEVELRLTRMAAREPHNP